MDWQSCKKILTMPKFVTFLASPDRKFFWVCRKLFHYSSSPSCPVASSRAQARTKISKKNVEMFFFQGWDSPSSTLAVFYVFVPHYLTDRILNGQTNHLIESHLKHPKTGLISKRASQKQTKNIWKCLKTGLVFQKSVPFSGRPCFGHFNTGLAWYLDPTSIKKYYQALSKLHISIHTWLNLVYLKS